MAKLLPLKGKVLPLSQIFSSPKPKRIESLSLIPSRSNQVRVPVTSEQQPVKLKKKKKMEESSVNRVRLSQVVSECVKRWFQDTLKEAKAGDIAMQVLVGQMYSSGYGVPKDPQKGRAWISRASKRRTSAWKVSDKPPGYDASDSDSDAAKADDANQMR